MSYDLRFVTPKGRTAKLRRKHNFQGGTYCVGGTDSARFNITYNYGGILRMVFGPDGIRWLYSKTATEVKASCLDAMGKLDSSKVSSDYWLSTEGNVYTALSALAQIADMVPKHYTLQVD